MKLRVLLPSGDRKSIRADLSHTPCQFLASLSSLLDLDFSLCRLKALDTVLAEDQSLQAQGVQSGDVIEVEVPGCVDLSYCDIAKRRKSLRDWVDFFTELTQRLVPAQEFMSPEYVKLALSGQKETLRLLDVRDFRFPQWMYAEEDLSPQRLLKHCLASPVLQQFVLRDTLDQSFLVKLIASLDYGYCLQLRRDLQLRRAAQKPNVPLVLITPEKSRRSSPAKSSEKRERGCSPISEKPPSSEEVWLSDRESLSDPDTLVVSAAVQSGVSATSAIEID